MAAAGLQVQRWPPARAVQRASAGSKLPARPFNPPRRVPACTPTAVAAGDSGKPGLVSLVPGGTITYENRNLFGKVRPLCLLCMACCARRFGLLCPTRTHALPLTTSMSSSGSQTTCPDSNLISCLALAPSPPAPGRVCGRQHQHQELPAARRRPVLPSAVQPRERSVGGGTAGPAWARCRKSAQTPPMSIRAATHAPFPHQAGWATQLNLPCPCPAPAPPLPAPAALPVWSGRPQVLPHERRAVPRPQNLRRVHARWVLGRSMYSAGRRARAGLARAPAHRFCLSERCCGLAFGCHDGSAHCMSHQSSDP